MTSPNAIAEVGRWRGTLAALWHRVSAGRRFIERDRLFLWCPVLLGGGIALYFSLPAEPPVWIAATAFGVAAGGACLARRAGPLAALCLGLAFVAGGVAAAGWRTDRVAAPVLQQATGPVTVEGRIVSGGVGEGRQRYVLEALRIAALAPDAVPHRVRISLSRRADAPRLLPGDWIRIRASLRAPPPPAAPGAWDFARQSWFQGIGGVGFALGHPTLIDAPPDDRAGGFAAWLAGVRHAVAARIVAAREGVTGAVAAALLAGDRSAIPERILTAMRESGLAHLLAISGLHIGLVAGLVFFAVRALLALSPRLALAVPIKKWAAVAALIAAAGYLLLAGASVPTQRAFVMATFVLLAVVVDRNSLSVRLIAWAALLVLVIAPESLLGPSFQMSFGAATALIATYEALRRPLARLAARTGFVGRPALYLAAVALTSLVAGLATGPFAVYHFNRFADYGLLANLGAVPVMGFWVMPWGLISLLLMPFGAEQIGLVPMGWGIDAILWVAEAVAALPGAVTLVPAMPTSALGLIAVGGLWLCLWRRRWRFFGLVGVAAGLLVAAAAVPPDILVDGDARLMASRAPDGALTLSSRQRARFVGGVWLRRAGQARAETWPWRAPDGVTGLACDEAGCVQHMAGQVVAFVRDPRALAEDCRSADVVVSLVPVRRACPRPHLVIDRFDLWRRGGHAIWLDQNGPTVETVAAARGDRPWVAQRSGR